MKASGLILLKVMNQKDIKALSQEDAQAKVTELLAARKDAEKNHAEVVKEYESTIADMQEQIDKLAAQKDNPNAKAQIKAGKEVYELNAPKFRFEGRVISAAELNADKELVKRVLEKSGQAVLTLKKD